MTYHTTPPSSRAGECGPRQDRPPKRLHANIDHGTDVAERQHRPMRAGSSAKRRLDCGVCAKATVDRRTARQPSSDHLVAAPLPMLAMPTQPPSPLATLCHSPFGC
ncbi:hypothetical protein J1614_006271 [Plenodomus biglobosus]|nr:hypothetical protein J1614_006271 [Plenodomus biglobosus]